MSGDCVTPEQILSFRNRYDYPLKILDYDKIEECPSIRKMEQFHRDRLLSNKSAKVVLGVRSVVFWGNASAGCNLAIARANRFSKHASARGDEIADRLRQAKSLVDKENYPDALRETTLIPYIGASFASKVLSFLSPESCGVADSRIAATRDFDFGMRNGWLTSTRRTFGAYGNFCRHLIDTASDMNSRGNRFKWEDRDGTCHEWRAVDIERAYFQAAQ